jgi:hypothetical protein
MVEDFLEEHVGERTPGASGVVGRFLFGHQLSRRFMIVHMSKIGGTIL